MALNRDEDGIIGQIQPDKSIDGGDSLFFTGHWFYINDGTDPDGGLVKTGEDFVDFFEVSFGAYVRHPRPKRTLEGFGAYYKSPWQGCITKDQFTGMLLALISSKQYKALLRVLLHHALRLFLFAYATVDLNGNKVETSYFPGITGPDVWATMLRGFGKFSWIFWPLLCIFDVHTFCNAILHNFKSEDDVMNFMGKFAVSREYVPTPVSWLTSKIIDYDQLYKELKKYACEWRKACDIYHKWRKKLESLR